MNHRLRVEKGPINQCPDVCAFPPLHQRPLSLPISHWWWYDLSLKRCVCLLTWLLGFSSVRYSRPKRGLSIKPTNLTASTSKRWPPPPISSWNGWYLIPTYPHIQPTDRPVGRLLGRSVGHFTCPVRGSLFRKIVQKKMKLIDKDG